jgi:predicted amidohydrolase YtcJ
MNGSGSARADLLVHGRVFTADPERPWAEAVLLRGDRIVAVGSVDELRALAGDVSLDEHHAGDGVVLPGFVDAHSHLLNTGAGLARAQLQGSGSAAEIGTRLRAWAAEHPDAPRVLGIGWLWSDAPDATPTAALLDAAVPDRPVYLDANDLHAVWVNTAALAELGIDDDTPDPIGGAIVRDAAGHATGVLLENAGYHLAWPVMTQADDATRDRWLASAIAAYHESGTTTAVDMGLDRFALEALERAEQAGTLTLNVAAHWLMRRTGDPEGELRQVRRAAELARRHPNPPIHVVGIKIIVDGTIDGCTAGMLEPFTNGAPGGLIWDLAALEPVVLEADALGLQVAMHAIGDLAVRTALDALETVRDRHGHAPGERRHRIEHLEYVDAADVPRLADLGVTVSMQPVHCDPAIMPNWLAMLGEPRSSRGFAWPEHLAAGSTLAFGTDTPTAPHQALPNMYIASTRRSPGHPDLAPHRPDFALPLADAIGHATRDAAWASFAEDEVGMLRAGHRADLVVLDTDPFRDGPAALLDANVVLTVAGGRIVHGGRRHR